MIKHLNFQKLAALLRFLRQVDIGLAGIQIPGRMIMRENDPTRVRLDGCGEDKLWIRYRPGGAS